MLFSRVPLYQRLLLGVILTWQLSANVVFADRPMVVPGQYVVSYYSGAKYSTRRGFSFRLVTHGSGGKRAKRYHRGDNRCREILEQDPAISACVPNFVIRAADGDPYISECQSATQCNWGAVNSADTDLDLPQAWQISDGDPSVIVAVLDTGLDLTHPDIAGNVWINSGEIPANGIDDDNNGYVDDVHGVNLVNGGEPIDDNGHGTHVAGIIAAIRNNGIGIAGVAPRVTILPVKILNADGGGTIAQAISGIDYIVDLALHHNQRIVVFNNSWGGFIPDDQIGPLREAFGRADAAGILATVAAGNGGGDKRGDNIDSLGYYPARIGSDNVLAVAATAFDGRLAAFSNFGPNTVAIAAPGEDIRSLLAAGTTFGRLSENGTTVASGTSMATPFVTGVIALLASHFPQASYTDLRDRILVRSYKLPDPDDSKILSGGRVNAFYAVTDAEIPDPTPLPTSTPTLFQTSTSTPTAVPPTVTPTPTATTVPTETVSAAAPTPLPPTSFRIRVAPISKFRSASVSSNYASTKSLNLLAIEAQGRNATSYHVSLRTAECELADKDVSGANAIFTLRFNGVAKGVKKIDLVIFDSEHSPQFAEQFQTKASKKLPRRVGCAKLRKKVKLVLQR